MRGEFGRFRAFRHKAAVVLALITLVLLWISPLLMPEEGLTQGERQQIIRVAERQLGTPYSKMNCSKFTRKVYGKATGVWMPANYVSQRYYGWQPANKRRGDLLLYKDHVAIYYGHGQVIHSSNYFGRVVVSDEDYLYGDLGERRIR